MKTIRVSIWVWKKLKLMSVESETSISKVLEKILIDLDKKTKEKE